MKRTASALWESGLKDGRGTFSAERGVLEKQACYFNTRFENAKGINPEGLLAAAGGGCFSMALSAQLGEAGLRAATMETSNAVTFEYEFTRHCRAPRCSRFHPWSGQSSSEAGEGRVFSYKLLSAKITMGAHFGGSA